MFQPRSPLKQKKIVSRYCILEPHSWQNWIVWGEAESLFMRASISLLSAVAGSPELLGEGTARG